MAHYSNVPLPCTPRCEPPSNSHSPGTELTPYTAQTTPTPPASDYRTKVT